MSSIARLTDWLTDARSQTGWSRFMSEFGTTMRTAARRLLRRDSWLRELKRQGLQIGDDCRMMGRPNFGSEPYLVSIGNHVTICDRVNFITHDGGTWVFRDQPRFREVIKYGRITIYDNCFIGLGVILMAGINIGPNAIVAAGSVVTHNVGANTVAGGVPARQIMTVEEYAERCLQNMPPYDRKAYQQDKAAELLRLHPRPW